MPSAYQTFVKENMKTAPGATASEKMKAVAAMWRKHKGQAGGAMESASEPRHRRQRIVAPAGGQDGGFVNFSGGSASALGAANQATFFGGMVAAHEQHGDGFSFNNFLKGIGPAVTTLAPVAMKVAPMLL